MVWVRVLLSVTTSGTMLLVASVTHPTCRRSPGTAYLSITRIRIIPVPASSGSSALPRMVPGVTTSVRCAWPGVGEVDEQVSRCNGTPSLASTRQSAVPPGRDRDQALVGDGLQRGQDLEPPVHLTELVGLGKRSGELGLCGKHRLEVVADLEARPVDDDADHRRVRHRGPRRSRPGWSRSTTRTSPPATASLTGSSSATPPPAGGDRCLGTHRAVGAHAENLVRGVVRAWLMIRGRVRLPPLPIAPAAPGVGIHADFSSRGTDRSRVQLVQPVPICGPTS